LGLQKKVVREGERDSIENCERGTGRIAGAYNQDATEEVRVASVECDQW